MVERARDAACKGCGDGGTNVLFAPHDRAIHGNEFRLIRRRFARDPRNGFALAAFDDRANLTAAGEHEQATRFMEGARAAVVAGPPVQGAAIPAQVCFWIHAAIRILSVFDGHSILQGQHASYDGLSVIARSADSFERDRLQL
jgi:hypothetical protein